MSATSMQPTDDQQASVDRDSTTVSDEPLPQVKEEPTPPISMFTVKSRYAREELKKYLDAKGVRIIYSDTDTVMAVGLQQVGVKE